MPTFSIIVPVYNAEKTLRKCLESLRTQTNRDFEVHLIENGSKDLSNAICREYVGKDQRFLLHACGDNNGPSGARNIGLDNARGTYVTFLDSDDYVESNYLETLLQAFENADVVFFGYHQIAMNGTFLGDHVPAVSDGADYYETLLQLSKQDMFGYTWIKAFRREVIGVQRFSRELNLLEDEVFACEVLTEPKRVKVLPQAIYNYVTGNSGSLVGRTHSDYCRKVDVVYRAWKRLLEPCDEMEETLIQMTNAHVSRCMYYGFEREVEVKAFFEFLVNSEFFEDSTLSNEFTECVKKRDYKKLSRIRRIYRLKNKIAKLLKR